MAIDDGCRPQRVRRRVMTRYKYDRIGADILRFALDSLDLTPGELAMVAGVRRSRINDWLHGREDIPHYVARDLWVWLRNDAALELALDWADVTAHEVFAGGDETILPPEGGGEAQAAEIDTTPT